MNPIAYKVNQALNVADIVRVFDRSGIQRPTQDGARIEKMFAHANLVISAWDKHTLIGVARGLTDHSYCCYLSDLAVDQAYQKRGIGRQLIAQVRECIGEQVSLILLSAPQAMGYYPQVGFTQLDNAFAIKRKH